MATSQHQLTRSAYTLVELLVVMAALTVLAAVTLPTLKTLLSDQKVSSASRSVLAHLQAAQGRAIASNSPVAVILERDSDETIGTMNTVSRLSIGQVFPPYEGDIAGATGVLSDFNSDDYIDRLAVPIGVASLLTDISPAPAVFSAGDYLQLDDRQSTYVVLSITPETVAGVLYAMIDFKNPAVGQEKGDLLLISRTWNLNSRFRLYRKPTKSFLQTLTLPRGTCVDLSVSGFGTATNSFGLNVLPLNPTMIVFNPQGRIAYWTNGASVPDTATSLLHLMVGRTEQVSALDPTDLAYTPEAAEPEDTSNLNSNVNDNGNTWLTINPFTGAISSAGMQAGNEGSALAVRLPISRAFATHAITQSKN